jgi:heme A synthase
MNFLFAAHSGLRYLVLLAGLVAAVVMLTGFLSRRPWGRPSRISLAVFTGFLDLQALLGLAMVALGRFYPSLMGHIVMMVLAVVAAHGLSISARKQADGRRAHSLGLIGVVLPLVLIVLGIGAIGRGVFESRAGGAVEATAE